MKWKEFKDRIDAEGVEDDEEVHLIDWIEGYEPRIVRTTMDGGSVRLEIIDNGLNAELDEDDVLCARCARPTGAKQDSRAR